jgi:hypothetical protein
MRLQNMTGRPAPDVNPSIGQVFAGLALAFGVGVGPVVAQAVPPAPGTQAEPGFATLQGRWVRPDGGYAITIRSVDGSGKMDAAYANPNPLPFARAEATRDGRTIRAFFELRAGGYNGSTYTLAYDPSSDVLKGVYYQAVAQQKYDVYFMRAK